MSSNPHIIALLTDFGTADPYVGVMKGVILSRAPRVTVVDLSHEVPAGNVTAAAFLLRSSLGFFPRGTVFLAVVDPGVGSRRKALGLQAEGFHFVGPDNGLFAAALEGSRVEKMVELAEPRFRLARICRTFHGRDLFAPAAAALSRGVSLSRLGPPLKKFRAASLPQPRRIRGGWRGEVLWVDRFGNLITNLTGAQAGDKTRVRVGRKVLRGVGNHYAQADVGKPLALLGSFDRLEISVRQGRADDYFHTRVGGRVEVFQGGGSPKPEARRD